MFKMPLLLLLIIVLLLFTLTIGFPIVALATATTFNYDDLVQSDDGFGYLTRDNYKKAGICYYIYDPEINNNIINIPEKYEDYPVKGIGGYVGKGGPCPFGVEIKGIDADYIVLRSNGSFDWYKKTVDFDIIYYDMVLNIGPNIREIYADDGGRLSGDQMYVVRYYVNCDPKNRKFYSKDGILYRRNGEEVDDFLYWDRKYISD